jgi:hemolysin III
MTFGGRPLSRHEVLADGIVHFVGIVGAVAGVGALLGIALLRGEPAEFTALAIYGGTLLAMLGCSAAYNLVPTERWRELLRRFDHAAIFALIAGTYTPFTALHLEGLWASWLTATIWSAAAIGITLRLWWPYPCEPCFVVLYLALGWIGVVAIGPLASSLGLATVTLMIVGGLLYSTGVIFHAWERLPFQRAVWHGFVVAAAGVHYAAVLIGVIA